MFRKSKPLIRSYEQRDNGFLWAAYQKGSFALPDGLEQHEFLIAIAKLFGGFPLVWVVEDDSKAFKSGRGQVALVGIQSDGWGYRPHAHFFKWATRANKLRAAVGFFHMMRNTKTVGVCEVRTTKKDFAYMKHMEKYGVLYLRGKLPKGSPAGDLFIFSIDGKR